MGRTAQQNFDRRFGNPPRIITRPVSFSALPVAEAEYRKERIFGAYTAALKDLLGREPTPEEVLGKRPVICKLVKQAGGNQLQARPEVSGCINNGRGA